MSRDLDLAAEVGAEVGIVEAGVGGAAAVQVDLAEFGVAGCGAGERGRGVVEVPGEEVHAAGLGLGRDRLDDVELAVAGEAEILEGGVREEAAGRSRRARRR